MIITFKDPNLRIHGKLHKRDPYYFRVHYGKQRLVSIQKEYIDRPTENQKASRNTFTTIRKEVARQLKDGQLRARWQAKFKADPQGYKFLHTYVYAQLKAGVTITQSTTCRDALLCVSPHGTQFHQHRPSKRCSLKGDAFYVNVQIKASLSEPLRISTSESLHYLACRDAPVVRLCLCPLVETSAVPRLPYPYGTQASIHIKNTSL